jgi:hypothetical protein
MRAADSSYLIALNLIVLVMKLLVAQFSLPSYYYIPLQSKYSPQHPLLKYLVCVLALMQETNFHTHTKLKAKFLLISLNHTKS